MVSTMRREEPGQPALLRSRGSVRPARQSSLREHNLSLVLRHIVDAGTPMTRARLAKAVGLTRPAVSDLVDRLIAARLVVESAPESVERAGRPGVPLLPAPGSFIGVGVEVAVDHIGVRALDLAGTLVTERIVEGDFRASEPFAILERVTALADLVVAQLDSLNCTVAGVCLSVPGLTDPNAGIVRYAPNLVWQDVDALAVLRRSERLRALRLEVGNDANLAARAEARQRTRATGGSRLDQNFLFISGEVGIGGAIVLAGDLAVGLHGWSGEIGHTVVDPAGPQCGCGATGCLEQYAGKDAILRRAKLPANTSVSRLLARAQAGNREATTALTEAAQALGFVASSSLNLLDLDAVVLGGFYGQAFHALGPTVRDIITQRVLAARWVPVEVESAVSGDFASLSGAAQRIVDRVVAHPAPWLVAR
jgi:predicted NBD/HSP70 family sugar kinase